MLGTRLGPYEITALIGAGGMGEVYRAVDTRLDRRVAIKVLPAYVASDTHLRQRFEREARTIAGLNHPHICVLHDVGREGDVDFLVMEELTGETLADRLKKGPLPIDLALKYAIEILDALDKAHRHGVVHRDLKPANIFLVTRSAAPLSTAARVERRRSAAGDSYVKLLDFGLAKVQTGAVVPAGLSRATTGEPDLTGQGTILGTIQYMAPEQLEGADVDARTDIFAFGAVLYEMVTGRKAFEGKSQVSLMAAILDSDPKCVSELQPLIPPALEQVIQGCLAKASEDRWQTAHDVMKQLQWIAAGGLQAGASALPSSARTSRSKWAWIAASFVVGLALASIAAVLYLRVPEDVNQTRFLITPAELAPAPAIAVSPDGRRIAFLAKSSPTVFSLFVRSMESVEFQMLPGTTGAVFPFWSPDSRHLGFFANGALKRIDISGGPPQTVCETSNFVGGTWGADGTILFGTFPGPVKRVSASGGEPTDVTAVAPPQEVGHASPVLLPDGRHFLFMAFNSGGAPTGTLNLGSLDSKQRTQLVKLASAVSYAAPGYVLFHRNGTLMAQPFDIKRLSFSGDAVRIADGVAVDSFGVFGNYSVSNAGVLVFHAVATGGPSRLTWYDRSGKPLGAVGTPGEYRGIALSPDGKLIAVHQHQQPAGGDIWVLDQERGAFTPLTSNPSHNISPMWSRDGRTLAFASDRDGGIFNIYQKPSGGGGNDEQVLKSK